MQVIVTYSECASPFMEKENVPPDNNRSDGDTRWKKQGLERTTLNLSAWDRLLHCPE